MTDDYNYYGDGQGVFFFSDWFSNGTFNYDEYQSDVNNLDSRLQGYSDIAVQTFLSTTAINVLIFLISIVMYELLRRCFPNVYASRQEKEATIIAARQQARENNLVDGIDDSIETSGIIPRLKRKHYIRFNSLPELSRTAMPLDWIGKIFGVPWRKVREVVGLDAYFYLRYIRICFKITSVSAIWGAVILFPVYAAGDNGATGWYYVSMANVSQGSPIIWVSMLYIYFFTFFVLFVMKQEYKHFVELRLDFLGKGDGLTEPQHQYSVMVENIPRELRGDNALFNYFDKLFPGKVHSAKLILKLPKLEALSATKLDVTKALEKSIAYYEANGKRPSHIVGHPCTVKDGIEMDPIDLCLDLDIHHLGNEDLLLTQLQKGARVDSIDYYTQALQRVNDRMFLLQKDRTKQAGRGDKSIRGFDKWFTTLKSYVDQVVDDFRNESKDDDDEIAYYTSFETETKDLQDTDSYYLSEDGGSTELSHDTNIETRFVSNSKTVMFSKSVDENKKDIDKPANQHETESRRLSNSSSNVKESTIIEKQVPNSSSLISTTSSSSSVYVNTFSDAKSTNNEIYDKSKYGMNMPRNGNATLEKLEKCSSLDGVQLSRRENLLENDQFTLNVPVVKAKSKVAYSAQEAWLSKEIIRDAVYEEKFDIYKQNSDYFSCDSRSFEEEETESKDCLRDQMISLRSSLGWNKLAGRLGFDFGAFIVKIITRRIHVLRDEEKKDVVSSTGFVTFLDLATVACVVSAPLTHKPQTLNVKVAPERRDLIWENCCRRADINTTREFNANVYFILGALLWSIPLVGIQAFTSAEMLGKLDNKTIIDVRCTGFT